MNAELSAAVLFTTAQHFPAKSNKKKIGKNGDIHGYRKSAVLPKYVFFCSGNPTVPPETHNYDKHKGSIKSNIHFVFSKYYCVCVGGESNCNCTMVLAMQSPEFLMFLEHYPLLHYTTLQYTPYIRLIILDYN